MERPILGWVGISHDDVGVLIKKRITDPERGTSKSSILLCVTVYHHCYYLMNSFLFKETSLPTCSQRQVDRQGRKNYFVSIKLITNLPNVIPCHM